MAEQIDRMQFIALLTERFPAVAADVDECARGLLHLEMGALARATQAAISDEDTAAVKGYFACSDSQCQNNGWHCAGRNAVRLILPALPA